MKKKQQNMVLLKGLVRKDQKRYVEKVSKFQKISEAEVVRNAIDIDMGIKM